MPRGSIMAVRRSPEPRRASSVFATALDCSESSRKERAPSEPRAAQRSGAFSGLPLKEIDDSVGGEGRLVFTLAQTVQKLLLLLRHNRSFSQRGFRILQSVHKRLKEALMQTADFILAVEDLTVIVKYRVASVKQIEDMQNQASHHRGGITEPYVDREIVIPRLDSCFLIGNGSVNQIAANILPGSDVFHNLHQGVFLMPDNPSGAAGQYRGTSLKRDCSASG